MSQKDLIKAIQGTDESTFNALVVKTSSLEGATFKGVQVGAMRIHTANCSNTEWEACIFDGTTFDGVDLNGSFFNGCTFYNCVFSRANLAQSSFDGCVFSKSSIVDASGLEGVEVTNSQFKECTLRGLHFVDGTLESITLTSGRIASVDGSATVKSMALRNVEVEGFETGGMEMSGCTASGCNVVPAGFTPSAGRRRRV